MAKKDMLNNMDEVTGGADMQTTKAKKLSPLETKKIKKKMLTLNINEEWLKLIKNYSNTMTGYVTEAVREKMKKDGLL